MSGVEWFPRRDAPNVSMLDVDALHYLPSMLVRHRCALEMCNLARQSWVRYGALPLHSEATVTFRAIVYSGASPSALLYFMESRVHVGGID